MFNGGVGEVFFTCFILIIFYKQSESMADFAASKKISRKNRNKLPRTEFDPAISG